jgi:hypothetical protein
VRAKLALQGIESNAQKVTVGNDTWHRIRIGPIAKLDEVNRMRQIFAQGRCRRAGDSRRRLAPRSPTKFVHDSSVM